MLENARKTWNVIEIIESVVKGRVKGVFGAIRRVKWKCFTVLENDGQIWIAIE